MDAAEQHRLHVNRWFYDCPPAFHRNLGDMYMAVLWPDGIGRSDSWVMWTSPSIYYTQNAGLDTNHDGTITRGEAAGRVYTEFKMGEAHKA